jgi:voltage-gated potassium channel
VGYGDLAPVTSIGKIFTIVYLFFGIGIILSFINMMTKQRIYKKVVEISGKRANKEIKKLEKDLEEKDKKLKKVKKAPK